MMIKMKVIKDENDNKNNEAVLKVKEIVESNVFNNETTVKFTTNYDKTLHICHECQKSFSLLSDLISHKPQCELNKHRTIHSGIKTHLCDVCGKAFAAKNSLIWHKKRHFSK